MKTELGSILEKLAQDKNGWEQVRFDTNQDDCENEKCASTQFLQLQKTQLIGMRELLERFCEVLPMFGFNSAKHDLKLVKSFLLTNLIYKRDIEPTVFKKASQFIPFKFGDF